jgi:excisionase family DNA binding protein
MTTVRTKLMSFERALKARELAKILALDKNTVYAHTRENRIPCFRIGTSVRYDPSVVAEWWDGQRVG